MNFEVNEGHLPLWEQGWRYSFLMDGRGRRSDTASRYNPVSRLLADEYMRGAMGTVHADIHLGESSLTPLQSQQEPRVRLISD